MKFRKKPVVINAEHVLPATIRKVAEWCGGRTLSATYKQDNPACIEIPTLEGLMRAEMNVWVIKGVKGEFYPCKPDIFAATYEPNGPGGEAVTVKRYQMVNGAGYNEGASMEEDENGPHVLHSDFAALQSKADRLAAKAERLITVASKYGAVSVTEANALVEALAAYKVTP